MDGRVPCQKVQLRGGVLPVGIRNILSLQTASAELGFCLLLPTVGNQPPAGYTVRFLKGPVDDGDNVIYEDLAYIMLWKCKSFWPQSKVIMVQTNCNGGTSSPKYFVTGDACGTDINRDLHLPGSSLRWNLVVGRDGMVGRCNSATSQCCVTPLCLKQRRWQRMFYFQELFAVQRKLGPRKVLQGNSVLLTN